MTNRIGDYIVDDDDGRLNKKQHDDAIAFLRAKGKRNPVSYGIGGIVVHHKSLYYMINTQSYKWCPRRRSHEKWRRAKSMDEVWEGMEYNSKWANHYSNLRKTERDAEPAKITTWYLYGVHKECDDGSFRTFIMSSINEDDVVLRMKQESIGIQYTDMLILHFDVVEDKAEELAHE